MTPVTQTVIMSAMETVTGSVTELVTVDAIQDVLPVTEIAI